MPIPVTLDDAKRQIRVTENDQDTEILHFIADAVAWCEQYTGHILVARDVTEAFNDYRSAALRAWPIAPSTVPGVAYTDDLGQPVAITGARLDLSRRPARVLPGSGWFWPFRTTDQLFTVTVRAGYEDDDIVPGNFRRAILVLIGAYDADREGGETLQAAEKTARRILSDFRVRRL